MFSLSQGNRRSSAQCWSARCCSARSVGWASLRLRHYARDPQVEITLSLLTPYIAYWVPEHLGGSGVIATVACGLYISWNGPLLISAATRLQGIFFWDLVIYLIEGLLFLLTGFADAVVVREIEGVSGVVTSCHTTALVAIVIVVARFVWVFPGHLSAARLLKSVRASRSHAAVAMGPS